MSDDDRALIGRERRRADAPGLGIISRDNADTFTPVTNLLEQIEDPKLRAIIQILWQHTANVELRAEQRIGNEEDLQALRVDVDEMRLYVSNRLVELSGSDGKNGKVGALRADHDRLASRAWWFLSLAIGGLGAALVKLVIVTHAFSTVEATANSNAARLTLVEQILFLRGQRAPAPSPPEKATP